MYNKFFGTALVIFGLILMSGCVTENKTISNSNDLGDLKVEISIDKEAFLLNESINITIIITNIGEKEMKFDFFEDDLWYNLGFELIFPNGSLGMDPFTDSLHGISPYILKSQESKSITFNLIEEGVIENLYGTYEMKLNQTGKYSIQISFGSQILDSSQTPIILYSNVLEFNINKV